ncbi:uncharacterized [Tachysurus ichikawai]
MAMRGGLPEIPVTTSQHTASVIGQRLITLIKAVPSILNDNRFTVSALKLVLSVALAHGQPQHKRSIVVNRAVCLNKSVLQFINGFQGQAHSSPVRGSPENKKEGKLQERKTVPLLEGK